MKFHYLSSNWPSGFGGEDVLRPTDARVTGILLAHP